MARNVLVVGSHAHDQVQRVVTKLREHGVHTRIVSHEDDRTTGYAVRDGKFYFDNKAFNPDVIWAADKYTIIAYGKDDRWAIKRTKELEWRSINRNIYFLHANKTRNPPCAIYFEFRKLEQMAVALECGFRMPSWCITDHLDELREAVTQFGQAIYKPIGERSFPIFGQNGVQTSFTPGTKILDDQSLEVLANGTLSAPIFVQKRIERAYEIRSIVIGAEVFHFRTYYRNENSQRERVYYQHSDCVIEPLEEDRLDAGLHRFMNTFGLHYGHFDFIVDPSGQAYFLECNPNGVWFNFDGDGVISDALANNLAVQ